MMRAYQIRVYEFNDRGAAVLERQVIALLTPAQRNELEAWNAKVFPGKRAGSESTIVPFDLHNFDTVKTALSIPVQDLVAGAMWPNAPTGRVPFPGGLSTKEDDDSDVCPYCAIRHCDERCRPEPVPTMFKKKRKRRKS